jgi:NAD(P)-dependent dehydrogenase (short-subunit alcohol dehydrogenase family)
MMADNPPRVAVVTGAGSGIGAAVAHALAGQAVESHGRVDLLFNNAGTGRRPANSTPSRTTRMVPPRDLWPQKGNR